MADLFQAPDPAALLEDAARIFRSRNAEYGASYTQFGGVLSALMGGEITLRGPDDFGRFAVLVIALGKLHRYANNFHKGGHDDSLADLSAYAAMLRHLDGGEK